MGVKAVRITVETETLMVVRRARVTRAWCPGCGSEVDVITLENRSLDEHVTAAQFDEWLGTGRLHLLQAAEPASGTPTQICVSSLLRCFEPATGR